MKIRLLLSGMSVAGALLAAGPAFADILDLSSAGGGTAIIKFNNYESFGNLDTHGDLQVGTTNFGTFEITSITVNGNAVYAPGVLPPNTYLVGVFDGITVQSITPNLSGVLTGNSGGDFQIWEVTASQLSLAGQTIGTLFKQGTGGYAAAGGGCAVNQLCYNGITNVGGTDFLNFGMIPGADAAGDTLAASINATVVPITGEANGYGDITGGVEAPAFLTGQYTTALGTKADVSFSDNFCPNGSSGNCAPPKIGNWADESYDPAQAQVIPEPGSMALLGSALLVFGLVGYRQMRRPRA